MLRRRASYAVSATRVALSFVVVKNTLMRRALSETDSVDYAELYESLKGKYYCYVFRGC